MIGSQELAEGFWKTLQSAPAKDADAIFVAFVELLEEHKLLPQLKTIVRYLESYAQKEKDFNTLFIETPFPLDETLQEKIQSYVGIAKKTEVTTIHNEKLLGGFRTRYQGVVTDASIAYNLQVLKKQLIK